jgi:hypothetical protein
MKLPRTLSKITRSILVFSLFFSMQTSIVLADDATTPEPAVSEQAPSEDAGATVESTPEPENTEELSVEATEPTMQPASAESETPVGETEEVVEPAEQQNPTTESTTDPTTDQTAETQASEAATPTAEADLEPEISEILAAAEEADVELIPVGDEDEIVAMGSNEAAEILSGGDPYFQDAGGSWIGYTSLGGTCAAIVTTCNQVATPVQAAINAAPTGATIYVEQDTYTEDIVISKKLTLAGLWVGNEDFADRPTLQGSVTILADEVHLSGWIIDASGKSYGIVIQGDYVRVDNSQILNATNANIFVTMGDYPAIANNTIANGGTGIRITGSNIPVIENNIIDNNYDGVTIDLGTINAVVYGNNITNNNNGILFTAPATSYIEGNYYSGNTFNNVGVGPTDNNPSLSELSLPTFWGFVAAPGTTPGDDIIPPSNGFVEFYHPIDGDYSELDCGAIWDANLEVGTNGEFQRYVNNVWVRYDAKLKGWVHDMGQEGNIQYLRKANGSWYNLTNGVPSFMPNITDNNWSVLDGNWCLNPGGGHLMYEDCFLYYYQNGNFIWAQSTTDGSYYDYDPAAGSWIERN